MKKYLECGKIVSTQGLKGEVRVYSYCNSLDELCDMKTLYFDIYGKQKVYVEKSRINKNVVIMKFKEVNFIDEAERIIGQILYADRNDIFVEEGSYFIQDIIGCEVYNNTSFDYYGIIIEVTKTGANDVYHIKSDDGKVTLIPSIPSVVINIDIEKRKVFIEPLKGLF